MGRARSTLLMLSYPPHVCGQIPTQNIHFEVIPPPLLAGINIFSVRMNTCCPAQFRIPLFQMGLVLIRGGGISHHGSLNSPAVVIGSYSIE